MSGGSVLSTVFSAGALVCSHCGSTELYPYPGLLGGLGCVLGRVRYACPLCRRHSWLSPHAALPRRPTDDFDLQLPPQPHAMTSLEALDIDIEAAVPTPPSTDLRSLDEALGRGRRRRGRRKR
jgi:hypothetical protein